MKKVLNIKGELVELSFEDILKQYKGLIVNKCKKYKDYYEFEDLYQMASLGLWEAYKKHEPQNGDFTNLAYHYVKQYINWHRQNNKDKSYLETAYIKEVNHLESVECWKNAIKSDKDDYMQAENQIFLQQAKKYILDRLYREKSHSKRATLRNLEFMDLIKTGYTQVEISKKYKLNLTTVQRGLYKEYKQIRKFSMVI